MQQRDFVATLEALYAIENYPDDRDWMRAVVKVVPPLVPDAMGMNGLMYDLSKATAESVALVNDGSPLESKILARAVETSTDQYANEIARTPVSAASEVPGYEEQPWLDSYFRPRGVEDVLTLNAYNPVGIGCSIAHAVSSRIHLSARARSTLTKLSTHLAAAARLRFRLRQSKEDPHAILTASGSTVHAEGRAKLKVARTALRDATKHMERARASRRRGDSAAVLDEWKPLVSAEWTLVDHFESDGRRYILARANEPKPVGEDLLTSRERQVVALATMGHHTKLIAYELGIADATVRVLLGRAAHRLGAKSRADLLQMLALRR